MRGPAPSIVCPRCNLAAPPSDTIAPFTTCTGCGLSFDAHAKDRAIRPARPMPPPEPAEPPVRPERTGLRGYQIIGVLAVLFAAGAIKWQYSYRYRASREAIEAIEQENRADHERRKQEMAKLRALADTLKTGIASCDTLMQLVRAAPTCASAEATASFARTIGAASDAVLAARSAAEMDRLCTARLTELDIEAKRLDCH